MQSFGYLSDVFATARYPEQGKPLARNTRLYQDGDGPTTSYRVKLHATNVVTRHADGTATLANGGWNTPTTMDRISTYGSSHVFSERGTWYVHLQPDPDDPRPEWTSRTIPRPFTMTDGDPGSEPVKMDDGYLVFVSTDRERKVQTMPCRAGTFTEDPYQDIEAIYEWRPQPIGSVHRSLRYYSDGSGPRVMAHIAGIERIQWGSDSWIFEGREQDYEYKQCPHCRQYEAARWEWHRYYYGDYKIDTPSWKGYVECIERYGDADAWREAYLKEFREVKAQRRAVREWEERNRVLFYDGIKVDSDGYAFRPSKSEQRKLDAHERKIQRMRKRIDKFVNYAVSQLEAGYVPMPSGGDCWYCALVTDDGMPMGEAAGNVEHLDMHMKDKYVVPSLLVNALRERGYQDAGIYIHLGMNPETGMMGHRLVGTDSIKRDLTKYLRKRLIPAA